MIVVDHLRFWMTNRLEKSQLINGVKLQEQLLYVELTYPWYTFTNLLL